MRLAVHSAKPGAGGGGLELNQAAALLMGLYVAWMFNLIAMWVNHQRKS